MKTSLSKADNTIEENKEQIKQLNQWVTEIKSNKNDNNEREEKHKIEINSLRIKLDAVKNSEKEKERLLNESVKEARLLESTINGKNFVRKLINYFKINYS